MRLNLSRTNLMLGVVLSKDKHSATTDLDLSLKRILLTATAVVSFIIFSCIPPEPLEATITEFSTCKGWDTGGKPLELSDIFVSSEKHIFVCGYVQTNQPVTITIHWYYENHIVNGEILTDLKTGYFYSTLETKEKVFPNGEYVVEVVIGKKAVKSANFRIIDKIK